MSFWKKKDEQQPATEPVSSKKTPEAAESAKEQVKEAAPEVKPAEPSTPKDAPKESGMRFENVRSALGKGTVIQGKLSFDTPVRIDGKLSGEIYSTETILVGPSGEIDAKIEVKNLVVMGSVKGTISASNKVEIHSGGSIDAEVFTKSILMQDGALFNGSCSMGTEKIAPLAKDKEEKSSKKDRKEDAKPKGSAEVRLH